MRRERAGARVPPERRKWQPWVLLVATAVAGLYALKVYYLDPRVQQEKLRAELLHGGEMYVQRFLLVEREGRYESSDRYLSGCDMTYRPELDAVEPRASARIVGSELLGDTVLVRVEYLLLGRYYCGAFTADVHIDTVTLYVSADTTGLPRIDCDRIDAYRWGVEAMAPHVERFDEASRRAWETALREAAPLMPDG
jgi:hypothetical protein